MGAHPRVRGDDAGVADVAVHGWGSPPRARGRQPRHLAERRQHGLTPACAGTTAHATRNAGRGQAHPRVRGDDQVGCWGGTLSQAHPRVRGDDPRVALAAAYVEGSPPRARGRLGDPVAVVVDSGLTPACAGTTRPWWPAFCNTRAHPRVRGDDGEAAVPVDVPGGSPPRARGRRRERHGVADLGGLTPACAGTTHGPQTGRNPERAHPRVRGDDHGTACRRRGAPGSPPRARGRPPPPRPPGTRPGLTPACAGTTW